MNPTPNKITECDDEKLLCEWAAVYCMGWHLVIEPAIDDIFAEREFWQSDDGLTGEYFDSWEPTSPTEKGKAQAADLAVKYDLVVHAAKGAVNYGEWYHQTIKADNWQIAVVKAAILCAVGDRYE